MTDEQIAPRTQPPVLHLSGEYDLYRQDELDRALGKLYASEAAVLDMREVTYIDSTALGCLIRLKKRMAENGSGTVRLVGPQPNVRRVLELTRLGEIFEIHESLSGALE